MAKIDYINAHNGGIQMYGGLHNIVGWGNTAKHIAYVIATHGLADTVYGGSSMDFADEDVPHLKSRGARTYTELPRRSI